MRIMKISVLGACAIFMLSSCGEKKSNVKEEARQTEQQQAVAGTPYAEPELKNSSTAKLGGGTYQITEERRSDTSLPVVTDELGNRCYDNRVEVSILCDGQPFFKRSYTKDAFSDFLSASDKQGTVLLGMAFDADRSDSRVIRQHKAPGSDTSGFRFKCALLYSVIRSVHRRDTQRDECRSLRAAASHRHFRRRAVEREHAHPA